MECYSVLDCSVDVENFNSQGASGKRVNHKRACIQLGRDQHNDLVFRLNNTPYTLKDFKVLDKFKQEGKATVIFQKPRVNIMISNAPPNALVAFLKLVRVKSKIQPTFATDRAKLHNTGSKVFEEISPLTVQDVKKYKDVACLKSPHTPHQGAAAKGGKLKMTDITPVRSKKRSLEASASESSSGKPCKRLNMSGRPQVLVKLGKSPLQKASSSMKEMLKAGHEDNKTLNLLGKLTTEQTTVFDAIKKGLNVFFTGSAGTGKSYLLKKIIGTLSPDSTVASASTGVAASQIGGVTLHSFAGIGNGEGSLERCIQLASRPSVSRNWKRCEILIIDEISMVDAEFFDKLEEVARHVRKNDRPFGGIQLVLCGDFLQLPPVTKKDKEKKFCFQSKQWSLCINVSFELTQVKRQNDQDFIKILQYVRLGRCPDEVLDTLVQTKHNQIESNNIVATRLCTHRESVEEINISKMKEIKGQNIVFYAKDSHPEYTEAMEKSLQTPRKLVLKVGAQVMLTKNLDLSKGLVNGARGVVVKFTADSSEGLPEVQFVSGARCVIKQEKFLFKTQVTTATRFQIPLKLAWAISIHKSQGLRVLDVTKSCIKANRTVLQFYIKLRRDLRIQGLAGVENEVQYR
ncbi:ATP-dependent DNA helicase PIF1-like isoform X2 [Clytia hemisphaerica]|uniref:ATP-dependent DNA helicase PIF1-like isoform X2 n=1 Tax=Clytia hemisphaerica TaxID=252671 RepID=UPI0034D702E4